MKLTVSNVCTLVVVLSTYAASVSVPNCEFPATWAAYPWMTHRISAEGNNLGLITYRTTRAYTSNSTHHQEEGVSYTCDSYEETAGHTYYIRVDSGDSSKLCVDEKKPNDGLVLLHQQSTPTEPSILENCKASLAQETLYSMYLPVTAEPGEQLAVNTLTDCPFPNDPYLVTYRTSSGGNETCYGRVDSVLTISPKTIGILACDYKLYPRYPLTGQLRCRATVDPTDLGEADSSNGGILLFEWQSKTQLAAFIYCARYKIHSNRQIDISVDVTSTDDVMCQRGSKHDWFGDHNGREYIKMTLTYDSKLASKRPTTPMITTAVPLQPSVHMQVALETDYDDITQTAATLTQLRQSIANAIEVDPSRVSDIRIDSQSTNGKAVVTFDLKDGTPSITDSYTGMTNKISSGLSLEAPQGVQHAVTANSLYTWRDDDPCQAEKCQNGGRCWVMQGVYSCTCKEEYTGTVCGMLVQPSTVDDPSISKTTLIIIAIVCSVLGLLLIIGIAVFVVRRQRKDKTVDNESTTGYENELTSAEDRDREMFATITKKPKAYHEKSFNSLNDDGHGELTGIHL